jgi:DME family drug/metabolite transporter
MYSQKRNAGESFGLDRRQATRSTCGCGGGLPLELFAKILYAQGVSFESLVAVRAFVGWLAVIGFLLLRQGARSLGVGRRDLAFLVPLGLVGIGTFYLLYFYTVRESTVGTAAVLLYSAPAFVVILARLFLKEPLNTPKVFALLLTACGIFLVVGAYDPANLEVSPKVLLTGLLSGLTYGLYAILGRPLAGHLGPAVILSYALAFGSVLLAVAALPTLDTLAGLPASSYALLVMLAVIHTSVAFALYTFGIRHLGAGRAAIVATVEPVVAGILGVALLGEGLGALKVLGGLLVLAGAGLAQLRQGKARNPLQAARRGSEATRRREGEDAF